ncbi:MAG: CapA family protein [Peptococcaceae bacterium]|nr:CapA family protein [Peptococcaceae bacterium]
MLRINFFKLTAVLACFVAGSLMVGTAVTGMDPDDNKIWEKNARESGGKEVPASGGGQGKSKGVVIAILGNVVLDPGEGEAAANGPDYPWRDAAGVIREADLTIANLECPVSDGGEPDPGIERPIKSSPGSLAGAAKAGVDVFTLANDHVLDFGREAMMDTINNLAKNNIKYAGAGLNEGEATRPAVIDLGGKKVAVLAFSRIIPRSSWIAEEDKPGIASGHNYKLMLDCIRAAENIADITVVCVHWGQEYEEFPDAREIHLARALVDAGADIVVGQHPHVLQGIEIYRGKVIAYSLGDFISASPSSPEGGEGAILQVTAGNEGEYGARIIPTCVKKGSAAILKGSDRDRVLERLKRICGSFKTSVDDKGEIHVLP